MDGSRHMFEMKRTGGPMSIEQRASSTMKRNNKPQNPSQLNCKFNVDANSGHAFVILLAAIGTLRPSGSGVSSLIR